MCETTSLTQLPNKTVGNAAEMTVPDLMASSSSIGSAGSSLLNKSANNDSFYHSCNGSLNATTTSISSYTPKVANHAFQNSGFFKKKQAKAAKKIQAIARGFLVRVRALKAPLLVELEDIDTRKLEELERIEAQKKVEKEAFLAEMEQESILLKQALMEAKTLIKKLKAEKTHYEDENASLKQECKDFKKANKKLSKEGKKDSELNVDAAMMQARVSNLERQTTSREDLVEQCLQNISKRQEQIRDAERQCELEKLQTQRLKVCISNVLDLVEPKSERLTEELLKIAMKNSVFL